MNYSQNWVKNPNTKSLHEDSSSDDYSETGFKTKRHSEVRLPAEKILYV